MTETERTQITGHPVILYDGICLLCNALVRFILRHDKRGSFRFAPLRSSLSQEILSLTTPPASATTQEGVILITDALTPTQCLHRRTDAVAGALHLLEYPQKYWSHLGTLLMMFPRPLREFGYAVIARLRYVLFGRYKICPVPTPDQRGRIFGTQE